MIEFWFDFASTYSYLSAMRVDGLAASRGMKVRWCPFLLGPIFQEQGWPTSPFNVYPAKGAYMERDIARIAKSRGIAFTLPKPFPQPSLLAARVALAIDDEAARAHFCRAVFEREFAHADAIDDPFVLGGCLSQAGLSPAIALRASRGDEIKAALRARVEEARKLGIFGAPTFVTADGELFWGDDRLDVALDWASSLRSSAGAQV